MKNIHLKRKLAAGSAVDAWLADSPSGTVLAQVTHPEIVADAELYGRFLDTTRATATRHRHPALLSAEHTRCEPDGRFVLLTGPVSGRTAVDHLREHGPLSSLEAVRWGVRVCDALQFLHAHDVVHGHLSPHNLFLEGDPGAPELRLLDTALLLYRGARCLPVREPLVPAEYLSPERSAGRRATVASDLYGMGVLLYELLTGRPPFLGSDPAHTRALHQRAALPPMQPGLEEWGHIFKRCLAKQPIDRFQSAADLRAALRTLKPLVTPELDIAEAPATPGALTAGDVLGRYRIERLLGEGGMGRVYEATHLALDRKVALKVLRRELVHVEAQRARFVAEAQIVNRVRHPNLVAIEDLVEDGEHVYLVMELLTGQTLKALARPAPLAVARSVRLIRQAAGALAAAHGVGIIHRDLKPDNLVVEALADGAERLKVVDFGVARALDTDWTRANRTLTGQVVGTPLWMAPEQVLGQAVDVRADIYSLSMVLYVLLARRFPWRDAELSQVVMHRLQRDPEPVGAVAASGEPISDALQALLQQALSRDVNRRPASMAQLEAALAALEHDARPAASPWWRLRRRPPRG